MSTNHTPNYALSQWQASDQVMRTEFNENHEKIDAALQALDAALAGKAAQSAVSALQSSVSSLQSAVSRKQDASSALKLAAGAYSGSGAESRTISVGFTPKAVFVATADGLQGSTNSFVYGGLAVTGGPVQIVFNSNAYNCVEITTNGFIVRQKQVGSSTHVSNCNQSGTNYRYVALG